MSGEFVFGDFPDVENSKNSDSLEFPPVPNGTFGRVGSFGLIQKNI
jgi:hypothetical protein